jgi:hypothetical protein
MKAIIGVSAIVLVLASGFAVYAINSSNQESKTSDKEVEDTSCLANLDEDTDPIQEQVKTEEKQPIEQTVTDENVQKVNSNADVQKNTSNNKNETTKNQSVEQNKAKSTEVNSSKQGNEEGKQVDTKPITYTSKGVGISFDMPASWANKYTIKDNGTQVVVYMKREQNLGTGDGCLFIITSNIEDYGKGSFLDSVAGINKITVVNGKNYLVGPPTDCRIELGDPDQDTYKTMTHQISQVLKTLR